MEHKPAGRAKDGSLLFVSCPAFQSLGQIQALWKNSIQPRVTLLRTQPGWALCTHIFPKITMFEGEGESKFQADEGEKGQSEGLSREQENQEYLSLQLEKQVRQALSL